MGPHAYIFGPIKKYIPQEYYNHDSVQFAVEVLDLVRRTLPVVSATAQFTSKVAQPDHHNLVHYATVETEHPYKQATVSHFKVRADSKILNISNDLKPVSKLVLLTQLHDIHDY